MYVNCSCRYICGCLGSQGHGQGCSAHRTIAHPHKELLSQRRWNGQGSKAHDTAAHDDHRVKERYAICMVA